MKAVTLFIVLSAPVATTATVNWDCNLFCYHGGECKHGKGNFGSYTEAEALGSAGYAGIPKEEQDVLPWDQDAQHVDVGMFCVCPAGYTGLQCEIAMKVCGQDEHTCFNGSACMKEKDKDGNFWWRCECDVEHSNLDASYAGKYCEHIATTFCGKKDSQNFGTSSSYCTNGGKCKEKDDPDQKHVGCICLEGFDGEHCEINNVKRAFTTSDYVKKATNAVAIACGVVIPVVLLATLYLYCRDKKKRKQERRRRRMKNAGIQMPAQQGEMA